MRCSQKVVLMWCLVSQCAGVGAQVNEVIFRDLFETHPFAYRANEPFDVLFFCELLYTDNNTVSQNRYYFDFDFDNGLVGGFTLDTGAFVVVNGDYTFANGQITITATDGFGANFAMTTTEIEARLGMVGYFRAAGQGLGRPAQLGCIAIGHGYDTGAEVYERYVCDDQVTAAGTYSNVIELSAFDSTLNQFVAGAAFRQRDYFATGTTTGDPTLIERNDFGLFRRQGGELYLDFTLGPLMPAFSDWNMTAALTQNNALAIDAFDPPVPPCPRVN